MWDEHESQWKTSFGHDKRYFLHEVDSAIRRISNPGLYQPPTIIPTDGVFLRRDESSYRHTELGKFKVKLEPHGSTLRLSLPELKLDKVIKPVVKPRRQGWDERFQHAIAQGQAPEGELLAGFADDFEETQWQW